MGLWDSFRSAIAGGNQRQIASVADSTAPTAPPAISGPQAVQRANDGIFNRVAGLGTDRDKRVYSEYYPVSRLTDQVLRNMFRGSWISRRIVTTVADDMTREGVALTWDGRDEAEEDAKAIAAAEKALQFWKRINSAVRLGRQFGGAAIIVVIRGEDWSLPLDLATIKRDSLIMLKVKDKTLIAPYGGLVDQNPESPNHGLPEFYTLSGVEGSSKPIHWTRVVRFGGQEVDEMSFVQNGYWDDSVLQTCVDSIKNYDSGRDGAASLLHEANVDILKVGGLTALLGEDGGEARIASRYQAAALMKSLNRMMILNGGEGPNGMPGDEFQQKTVSFTGIPDVLQRFLIDLCGAADIPATRLFGMSPTGMNATGESDIRNYYDHCSSDQESQLRAPLAYLYEVVVRSALGRLPDGFGFTFNPLWQMSDKELAEIENIKAGVDDKYIGNGTLTRGAVARELLERNWYTSMTEDDVALAEEADEEPLPDDNVNADENVFAAGEPEEMPDKKPAPAYDAANALPAWFSQVLADNQRVVVVGGPKTGKTTLTSKVTGRPTWSTDSLIGNTDWEAAPAAIKSKAASLGDAWVIEGVQVARALRSGMTCDAVVILKGARDLLSDGQRSMEKAIHTILSDWAAADGGKTKTLVVNTGERTNGADALGDRIVHEKDGWHVYGNGKHAGGPYKSALKASRRLRQLGKWDRR